MPETTNRSKFLINLLKKGSTIVGGFLYLVISTRYLGPSLRGEYMYLVNTVSLLTTILIFGISSIIPYHARNKFQEVSVDEFYSISITQLIISLFLAILFLMFGSQKGAIILIMTAVAVFSTQINNISLITDFTGNAIAYITSAIINVVLIIIASVIAQPSLYAVIIIWIIKNTIIAVILLRRANISLVKPNIKWIKLYGSSALPMITIMLVDLNYRIGVLLMKPLGISDYQIGIYTVGVMIAQYTWIISDIFKDVLLNENSNSRNLSLTNRYLRLSFSIISALLVLLALVGKWLFPLLFGTDFSKSYAITLSIIIAVPFMSHTKLLSTLFQAENKWIIYFKIMTVSTLLNIALCLSLTKLFGVYAISIATGTSYFISGILSTLYYARAYDQFFFSLFIVKKGDLLIGRNIFRNLYGKVIH